MKFLNFIQNIQVALKSDMNNSYFYILAFVYKILNKTTKNHTKYRVIQQQKQNHLRLKCLLKSIPRILHRVSTVITQQHHVIYYKIHYAEGITTYTRIQWHLKQMTSTAIKHHVYEQAEISLA
jgi:hypothetical protein